MQRIFNNVAAIALAASLVTGAIVVADGGYTCW